MKKIFWVSPWSPYQTASFLPLLAFEYGVAVLYVFYKNIWSFSQIGFLIFFSILRVNRVTPGCNMKSRFVIFICSLSNFNHFKMLCYFFLNYITKLLTAWCVLGDIRHYKLHDSFSFWPKTYLSTVSLNEI